MITAQSTTAEVIAHHRQNIAEWEATLAAAKDDYERADARHWIAGHRERLARAETIAALGPRRARDCL